MAKTTYIGIDGVAQEAAKGYVGVNGKARKIKKVYIGDENNKARECWSSLDIVSWASGTDEQIVAMVAAADAGLINLADYWSVGDERKVSLPEIPASNGITDVQPAQTVTLVLMNVGGKTLQNATASGRTTCSFVVGTKHSLAGQGYMHGQFYNLSNHGWHYCHRRAWCNDAFYKAIPATLRPIFKAHINRTRYDTNNTSGTNFKNSVDYFALPAEVEVFGTNGFNYYGTNEGTQFEWYKTSANRIKKAGGTGYNQGWFERSVASYNMWFYVNTNGSYAGGTESIISLFFSPFGCI